MTGSFSHWFVAGALSLTCLDSAAASASCAVLPLTVEDATRSVGVPFASPADPGHGRLQHRGLLWLPQAGVQAITYADLIRDVIPEAMPATIASDSLRWYGITVDDAQLEHALAARSVCDRASTDAGRNHTGGGVVILAAMPPVFYAGLSERLAQQGIPTAVLQATQETDLRLLLHTLIDRHGWNAQRIALVGHGYGAKPAYQLAAQWNAVQAIVSLDGFEGTDPAQHPQGSSDLRPGHLRAPILHLQPETRPHAHAGFFQAAMRSAYWHVQVPGPQGNPWATTAELSLAPTAFLPLTPALAGPTHRATIDLTAGFLRATLEGTLTDFAKRQAAASTGLIVTPRAALPAPGIITDGIANEPLWASARMLPPADGIDVKLAEDCDYLYLQIASLHPGDNDIDAFTTEVYLDPKGDSDMAWNADDLLLHASNSLCWNTGSGEMARERCGASEAWWGASRTARATDPDVAEYYIAKSRLGLSGCRALAPLRLAARIAPGPIEARRTFPQHADKDAPRTWHAPGATP